MNLTSFCGPCLKWKFVLACKGHSGFNGFLAPYTTKYLVRDITVTNTHSIFGVMQPGYPGTSRRQITIDRFTGAMTETGGEPATSFSPFPFEIDLTWQDWIVRDDYFRNMASSDNGVDQYSTLTEVTLSQPYPASELEADADALINAIDPASLDWSTLKTVSYPGDQGAAVGYNPQAFGFLPESIFYGILGSATFPPPVLPIEALRAAAWYNYMPSGQVYPVQDIVVNIPGYDRPGWYMKLVGFIQMAGNYCEKSYYVDLQPAAVGIPTCVSGQGGCGAPFKLVPPPLVSGQNGYKVIVPNCRCGDHG
ncbi:MAG: hypothetical protein JWR26_1163 [Pedosphaera sp.]|nr:hypothetical protein [Pedosphaera sp.]